MAKVFLTLLFLFFSLQSFAQQEHHTIYLKDGTVFYGEIIEKTAEGNYFVRTISGREMVFLANQIGAIESGKKETSNLENYGGDKSIGFSMLGSGIFGAQWHQGLGKNFYADLGFDLNMSVIRISFTESNIKYGPTLSGGLRYNFRPHLKERKLKVRRNGFFVNTGYTFSEFNATKFILGIGTEYYDRVRLDRCFLLDLGIGWKTRHWLDNPNLSQYAQDKPIAIPLIHLRLAWNYYVKDKTPAPEPFND